MDSAPERHRYTNYMEGNMFVFDDLLLACLVRFNLPFIRFASPTHRQRQSWLRGDGRCVTPLVPPYCTQEPWPYLAVLKPTRSLSLPNGKTILGPLLLPKRIIVGPSPHTTITATKLQEESIRMAKAADVGSRHGTSSKFVSEARAECQLQ
jgi:hypothetical protein